MTEFPTQGRTKWIATTSQKEKKRASRRTRRPKEWQNVVSKTTKSMGFSDTRRVKPNYVVLCAATSVMPRTIHKRRWKVSGNISKIEAGNVRGKVINAKERIAKNLLYYKRRHCWGGATMQQRREWSLVIYEVRRSRKERYHDVLLRWSRNELSLRDKGLEKTFAPACRPLCSRLSRVVRLHEFRLKSIFLSTMYKMKKPFHTHANVKSVRMGPKKTSDPRRRIYDRSGQESELTSSKETWKNSVCPLQEAI